MATAPHVDPSGDEQLMETDVEGETCDMAYVAHKVWTAAQAATSSTTGVLAAVTDNGAAQTITTGFVDPPCPRNITATAGGTAGDIKAVQVVIEGTDYDGEALTETLPAFTVDTPGSVAGSKAFKTVTSATIPAHDGTGATTSIGFGEALGLPFKLSRNTLLHQKAFLNNALEGTTTTVATSSTVLASNTLDLNSSLNGSRVDAYLLV